MNAKLRNILSWLLPEAYKPFTMFPYRFIGPPLDVRTGIGDCGFPYAEYAGIRVYFTSDMVLNDVETVFRGYLEDEGLTGLGRRTRSPHCYVTDRHRPESGEVIVDIGCSEGFFSRFYAQEAKRIYLFEGDCKWINPLKCTFSEFLGKTIFTPKFVCAKSSDSEIRLQDVLPSRSEDVYFLKLDVEGAEREILEASRDFLMANKIKMSCCTYHRQDDCRYLSQLLKSIGFEIEYSDGWMLPYGSRTFPFFRKGVIYAKNFN
jgi:hypothetical protein